MGNGWEPIEDNRPNTFNDMLGGYVYTPPLGHIIMQLLIWAFALSIVIVPLWLYWEYQAKPVLIGEVSTPIAVYEISGGVP